MSIFSRAILIIATALLTFVFFFPLWKIGLIAPQYPEGLSLYIWINKITGDIRTINTLNHYIGMSKIEPNQIPELRLFPFLFGFFATTGIVAAILNRRRLTQLWCVGLLAFAVIGLYDFYAWEYRYGHELSEDAPMKLEDSYQPPLIGTKLIANITASSWPEVGGYAFGGAAFLAFGLLLYTLRQKKN